MGEKTRQALTITTPKLRQIITIYLFFLPKMVPASCTIILNPSSLNWDFLFILFKSWLGKKLFIFPA